MGEVRGFNLHPLQSILVLKGQSMGQGDLGATAVSLGSPFHDAGTYNPTLILRVIFITLKILTGFLHSYYYIICNNN